jgi:hypothetical protein
VASLEDLNIMDLVCSIVDFGIPLCKMKFHYIEHRKNSTAGAVANGGSAESAGEGHDDEEETD